jgi:hypothetical protein
LGINDGRSGKFLDDHRTRGWRKTPILKRGQVVRDHRYAVGRMSRKISVYDGRSDNPRDVCRGADPLNHADNERVQVVCRDEAGVVHVTDLLPSSA